MLCPPTRFSAPLTPDFRSAFDGYAAAFRVAWKASRGYTLDAWQEDILRRITELRPDGHLRYRQVLVSMGRQNGKSELAAALGIWGLLRKPGALNIGVASSAEQARIIYQRTQSVIRGTPALRKRCEALTDTRGIRTRDGGRYEIKASKSAALQGLAIDLALIDEVHLIQPELWADLLNGTGSRDDCLIVGLTTAGDADSELLLRLYSLAESGEAGDSFGYFIWESPEATVPADDTELATLLMAANPSLATGRVAMDNVIADVRTMPDADIIRYRLNRFTSTTDNFVSPSIWQMGAQACEDAPGRGIVYALDRSPGWEYATLTASWKRPEGGIWTEVVASVVKPSPGSLVELCAKYAGRGDARAFVMDSYSLKQVGGELKLRGVQVHLASLADVSAASALFYANTLQRKIHHPGDPLLTMQLPGAKRKNVPGSEAFRVVRSSGALAIDAVMATVLGCYFAETLPDLAPQLYI